MQIAMIAAGFTPGRPTSCAARWLRGSAKAISSSITARSSTGCGSATIRPSLLSRSSEQIKGFGDYGFPESHAASFAHLVYASSWLKCHEPAIFLAALLNSQPMGFYPPSQLVQDAKRHVQVRPIDVTQSNWEASLEALPDQPPPHASRAARPVARAGSRRSSRTPHRSRAHGRPVRQRRYLARRAQLERRDLEALAAANALATLAGHRRDALWQAVAAAPNATCSRPRRSTKWKPAHSARRRKPTTSSPTITPPASR